MAIHLMDNEKVIWKSYQGKNFRRYHLIKDILICFLTSVLIFYVVVSFNLFNLSSFLLGFLIFIFSAFFIGVNQLKLLMSVYVVTNERVIIKHGWFNRRLTSIRLENIIDTKAEQSFFERLIKTGTIYLFTANDSQNSEDEFIKNVPKIANIDDPFKRHSKIVRLLKKENHE